MSPAIARWVQPGRSHEALASWGGSSIGLTAEGFLPRDLQASGKISASFLKGAWGAHHHHPRDTSVLLSWVQGLTKPDKSIRAVIPRQGSTRNSYPKKKGSALEGESRLCNRAQTRLQVRPLTMQTQTGGSQLEGPWMQEDGLGPGPYCPLSSTSVIVRNL